MPKVKPTIPLGRVVMTPGIAEKVHIVDVLDALQRHAQGDWGIVNADDWATNDEAVHAYERVSSAYLTSIGHMTVRFWIITEADRSSTTVLLPEEY